MFQVGDIVRQNISNTLLGIITEVKERASDSYPHIKILWFGNSVSIEYPYTYFDYFTKVS